MPRARRRSGFAARRPLALSSPLLAIGLAAVTSGLALTATRDASALPLLELSGSARWLYNAQLRERSSQLSSAGFGVSAGVTLPAAIYLGASFQYFVGTELTHSYVDAAGAVVSRDEFSNSSSQLLAHVGYDVGLLALTVRPSLGLGWWRTAWQTHCLGCTPNFNDDGLAISPGVEILYRFGLLNVSGEARLDSVLRPSGGTLLTTLFGLGAGVSF